MHHALHTAYSRAIVAERHERAARRRLIAAAALACAVAGCGSEGGSGVSPDAAKRSVERAANVRLASEPVPAQAREQGLAASFSNAATAVKDKQIVALFVLRSPDVADEVSKQVRSSAPRTAKLIVHDELMVVYAAAGSDHTAAVRRAVKEAS